MCVVTCHEHPPASQFGSNLPLGFRPTSCWLRYARHISCLTTETGRRSSLQLGDTNIYTRQTAALCVPETCIRISSLTEKPNTARKHTKTFNLQFGHKASAMSIACFATSNAFSAASCGRSGFKSFRSRNSCADMNTASAPSHEHRGE